MAVNHEIKSQLAKLLATEDLIVEHKQVDTACFNVHTRVLTLPLWEGGDGTIRAPPVRAQLNSIQLN